MIPIFESILPIFLIVLLGIVLRRTPFIDQSVWPGLETLGYYLFFPALLFLTLAKADFSGLELGTVALVSFTAVSREKPCSNQRNAIHSGSGNAHMPQPVTEPLGVFGSPTL